MMNRAGYQEVMPAHMHDCQQCSNPFPFVCDDCQQMMYKAIHDDGLAMGLSTNEDKRPTASSVTKPEPRLCIASGEDVRFHDGGVC